MPRKQSGRLQSPPLIEERGGRDQGQRQTCLLEPYSITAVLNPPRDLNRGVSSVPAMIRRIPGLGTDVLRFRLASKNARRTLGSFCSQAFIEAFRGGRPRAQKWTSLYTPWCGVYILNWLFTHHPISMSRDGQRLGVIYTLAHAYLTCLPRMLSWHS